MSVGGYCSFSRIIHELWEIYLVQKIWEKTSSFLYILIATVIFIAHTSVVHSGKAILLPLAQAQVVTFYSQLTKLFDVV